MKKLMIGCGSVAAGFFALIVLGAALTAILDPEGVRQTGKQIEELERKRKDAKASAPVAARKGEDEYDSDGLVLLKRTLAATRDQFGVGEITGMVVNRRTHKLSYTQITFNLYDESGAQIGSAMANINGLEPGGRWKFEASSLGKDFAKYKFSELSGF